MGSDGRKDSPDVEGQDGSWLRLGMGLSFAISSVPVFILHHHFFPLKTCPDTSSVG